MNVHLPGGAFLVGSVFLLGLLTSASVVAEPPSILKIFRSKPPLSDESLELKVEHGPWMILAYTLPGADAKPKAIELAREIRRDLKLPAFVMEKTSGVSPTLVKRERIRNDAQGNPVKVGLEARYANGGQESVYAVLVGEFTSPEDERIPDILQRVRTAHPAILEDGAPATANNATASTASNNWLIQQYRSKLWNRTDRKDDLGKMGAAFVTRNPLLPDDYFEAPKVDEFVAKLNQDVEYSLLDCPGKFTVRVASFTGRQATELGNGPQRGKLDSTTDALDQAALQSHELTVALRKSGVEAYEFHDRYGSYVMIGSFDSLGQELNSGEFRYHPGIIEINQKWCGYRVVDAKDPGTGVIAKMTSLNSLNKIPFDVEAKPMAVPRLATSNLYRGALLGSH